MSGHCEHCQVVVWKGQPHKAGCPHAPSPWVVVATANTEKEADRA